ncbi:hypothetical protein ACWOE5_08670 [Aerococcus sanguinicola]|uniref:ABC transporter permease n=1 Tax=Aerococcus sanguinicola TaxID=119206 RepID=A0A0X8F9Z9_9LACT|nr:MULTISPECIES: hypothetical protein [Aerococcus]AMB93526.1 hypothetical protein AWM72_01575 [Aerococcus sanguinicola]MDK7050744.1 hypothetical protein [Aerococcus sanguinicola]OFT97568.1 hypothetical protein HMPREF3090_00710 [Aerococcus sp. HMSC23C02]PKZ21745.1 hypothetical protein CYJ28_07530 [Aerococcus sanguinicola]
MYKKKFLASTAVALLLSPIALSSGSNIVQASQVEEETVQTQEQTIVTFTNQDIVNSAQEAYRSGQIDKETYDYVYATLNPTSRATTRGENKIVDLGNGQFDVYMNSLVVTTLVGTGVAAAGAILAPVIGPALVGIGISTTAQNFVGTILTFVLGSVTEDALSNGAIVRAQYIEGAPAEYGPLVSPISIRSQ